MIKHIKKWNNWRKHNTDCPMYKFLVLIGLLESPTFRFYRWGQITEKCKYFRSSATKEDILNRESVCSIPYVEQCPDDAGCPSDKNCKNCFMTGKEK